jgi:hypothetical protein
MTEEGKNLQTQHRSRNKQKSKTTKGRDQILNTSEVLSEKNRQEPRKETSRIDHELSTLESKTDSRKEKIESVVEAAQLPDIIYIQRNYNKYPNQDHTQFRTPPIYFDEAFPSLLERRGVSKSEFERTIRGVNERLAKAERVSRVTVFENCFGALTCFFLFLCYESQYSKKMRELYTFLQQENETVWKDKGLEWLHPLRNGFIFLEIKVHRMSSHEEAHLMSKLKKNPEYKNRNESNFMKSERADSNSNFSRTHQNIDDKNDNHNNKSTKSHQDDGNCSNEADKENQKVVKSS